MGLPLACKDADSLCPLPATVAEQYQSCDDSGEHTIWKCGFERLCRLSSLILCSTSPRALRAQLHRNPFP